jgi:hypothetical protein
MQSFIAGILVATALATGAAYHLALVLALAAFLT